MSSMMVTVFWYSHNIFQLYFIWKPDPEYDYECQEIKSKIDQNEEM